MKFLLPVFLALLLWDCEYGPTATPQRSSIPVAWEAEIQQFERGDRVNFPAPGGVLFVGSSSIRLWTSLAADFPGTAVINRGFGGAKLDDVVRYASRIVLPYRPRLVLVYAGENDLAAGKAPERLLDDYRSLLQQIHRKLPQTRIGFISIKPSPSRWHLEAPMRHSNSLVREYSKNDPRLFYIEVFTAMLDGEGRPREELFLEDRLHMNEAGYRIWRAAILPHL